MEKGVPGAAPWGSVCCGTDCAMGGQEVYIWVAYPLRIVNVHGYAPACGWNRLILLKNVKCLLLPK